MEFMNGICPKCKGEIQIPQGREKLICMYCGEEIAAADAVIAEATHQTEKTELEAVDIDTAKDALAALLLQLDDPMGHFKKGVYDGYFKNYLFENARNLALLENAYLATDSRQEYLLETAEALTAMVDEKLKEIKGKKRDDKQLDYNLSMVVYVFPALLENNTKSGQAWIDAVIQTWKAHFPKTDLKSATFKEINAGFKYRFCYITTAVCESLGKGDDCYELNLFREFRDQYLLQQQDGPELIHEYYDIAPTIVKHISDTQQQEKIYHEIWDQYLMPCVHMIEEDKNEECCELYRNMVYNLKQQYFKLN